MRRFVLHYACINIAMHILSNLTIWEVTNHEKATRTPVHREWGTVNLKIERKVKTMTLLFRPKRKN